ncbi:MAG: RecX family transcriptional regulator [Saprospiraceae bacterium]|nr:RecX family transcriptional regulator [Bacteroidia bacterium]NNE13712.1 RecX family transcriptional regulator [Saprospiraceae bacterium]NNL90983.1 RecX family transcriptional regulator [Saprospiraceae bacterium]
MEFDKALLKLQRYCAYQDRCHQEVRSKLLSIKVYGDDLEQVMSELIRDDYLNEERFAKSYSRGKFRIKKWGKVKILQGLKARHISDYCIKKGMAEIEDDEYRETIKLVLLNQMDRNTHLKPYLAKDKAIKYAISRGFETEIVYEVVKDIS